MLKRFMTFILLFLAPFSSLWASYDNSNEYERPNIAVLEMQLRENESLLFGKVLEIEQTVDSKSNKFHLHGFQIFKVKMEVDKLWSKKSLKPKPHYSFEFGTMIDESNMQTSIPVKRNERLVIVLDSYRPNEQRTLKDHMLNIYEHHKDRASGKEYFISKLTKHYNQKNVIFTELQRVAYLEKMNAYSVNNDKGESVAIGRSIASDSHGPEEDTGYDSTSTHNLPETSSATSAIKRRPNSSFSNQEDEFSVFTLLLVLVFLAVFSHFVIKYYETPDEEI